MTLNFDQHFFKIQLWEKPLRNRSNGEKAKNYNKKYESLYIYTYILLDIYDIYFPNEIYYEGNIS